MPYFIYTTGTDLISSLLDPRFIDPGPTLIRVGVYDPICVNLESLYECMIVHTVFYSLCS